MISIPFGNFTTTYQEATVPAGSTVTLWSFTIPVGYVAFIDQIRVNGDLYDPNVNLKFYIDIEEAETIDRWLVDRPIKFDPPYLATQTIEFIAYNESTRDYDIGVFCDGRIFDQVTALKEARGSIIGG